jgi:hypothetical protein
MRKVYKVYASPQFMSLDSASAELEGSIWRSAWPTSYCSALALWLREANEARQLGRRNFFKTIPMVEEAMMVAADVVGQTIGE